MALTPCGCTQSLEPTQDTFTPCDNAGSQAFTERGATALTIGAQTKTVTFATQKAATNYGFTELAIENVIDANPIFIQPQVTERGLDSFIVDLSAPPDSNNYVLRWAVYVISLTGG